MLYVERPAGLGQEGSAQLILALDIVDFQGKCRARRQ